MRNADILIEALRKADRLRLDYRRNILEEQEDMLTEARRKIDLYLRTKHDKAYSDLVSDVNTLLFDLYYGQRESAVGSIIISGKSQEIINGYK